jgi:hypothetical protein
VVFEKNRLKSEPFQIIIMTWNLKDFPVPVKKCGILIQNVSRFTRCRNFRLGSYRDVFTYCKVIRVWEGLSFRAAASINNVFLSCSVV